MEISLQIQDVCSSLKQIHYCTVLWLVLLLFGAFSTFLCLYFCFFKLYKCDNGVLVLIFCVSEQNMHKTDTWKRTKWTKASFV